MYIVPVSILLHVHVVYPCSQSPLPAVFFLLHYAKKSLGVETGNEAIKKVQYQVCMCTVSWNPSNDPSLAVFFLYTVEFLFQIFFG